MKLFEYESKSLAQNLGINTPKGGLASTPDEARDIHKRIGGEVVIKAQVLVAGRGKAGGIKFGSKPEETRDRASEILSMTIKGEKVKKVLIEQKLNIKKELFGSIVLDRANKCQTVLASDQGGIDIEDVAKQNPEKILHHRLDPVFGMRGYDARQVGLKLGYTGQRLNSLTDLLSNLYRLSVIYDAELVESNPLVETNDGKFVTADLRVIVDDNSLFRHPEFQERAKEASGGQDARNQFRGRKEDLELSRDYYARKDGRGCATYCCLKGRVRNDTARWKAHSRHCSRHYRKPRVIPHSADARLRHQYRRGGHTWQGGNKHSRASGV